MIVLFLLSLAALIVYGVPYVAERTGYAWEAGRARADSEALAKLDHRIGIDVVLLVDNLLERCELASYEQAHEILQLPELRRNRQVHESHSPS